MRLTMAVSALRVLLVFAAWLLVPDVSATNLERYDGGTAEFIKKHPDVRCFLTPKPPYPLVSRFHHEQGAIVVQVTFAKTGQVTAVKLLESSGYANLDGNTLQYIKKYWRSTYGQVKTLTVPLKYRLG